MKKSGETPFVQAVIVTWNKKKDVLRLLECMQHLNYPVHRFSILVVDNASEDNTVEAVEIRHPHVNILSNPENRGGAGGFNAGMRWALANRPEADYLWLVDNDALVDANALAELVGVMENRPNAAICGSRVMDIDQRDRLMEIGAFIDYQKGDVLPNKPNGEALADPKAVFKVDYVAACSLLARVSHIRDAGLWHEEFFIYWDDMEWGARFNAMGYEVLAANASVVYHPSWAGRVADNSAIWRSYYRVRNGFCFFNQYSTGGLKKQRLLTKMLVRFMVIAASAGLKSRIKLSMAFVQGICDFLNNRFGKIEFSMPATNLYDYFEDGRDISISFFVPDKETSPKARTMAQSLCGQFPNIRVNAIVPQSEKKYWECFKTAEEIFIYRRKLNGRIAQGDKLRLIHFSIRSPWRILICSDNAPRILTILGKDIACIDFERKQVISIESVNYKYLIKLPFRMFSFLIKLIHKSICQNEFNPAQRK